MSQSSARLGATGSLPGATDPVIAARQRRNALFLASLAALLVAMLFLAAGWGAVAISPADAVAALADALGLGMPWPVPDTQAWVFQSIRLPRVVAVAMVGASLAVCGAVLQGLFRNPLADPGLIGVSSGAALGAVTAIGTAGMVGLPLQLGLSAHVLPLAAFTGGLVATWLAYRIATRNGHTDVVILLLTGVALNAVAGAGIGFFIFVSDDQQLREFSFWTLGSFAKVGWASLSPAVPLVLLPAIAALALARPLNAFALGEVEAFHLGFAVQHVKRAAIIIVALAVGGSVALAGAVGFVGLVVPHLVRLMVGPDHRILLPASMMLGAALLLGADLLARTIVLPAELPIGVLTSCIGGPFFIWLLLRRRAAEGA